MDKFEQTLKDDADAIRADISPALSARLKASIRRAQSEVDVAPQRRSRFAWWWLSSLSGAAAVLVLVVFVNRGGDSSPGIDVPTREVTQAPVRIAAPFGDLISQQVVNNTLSDRDRRMEVLIGVAYGTDLEKAREKLGSDLRFTL